MGSVIIGMDPHKRSASIEIIDQHEAVLRTGRFGTDQQDYQRMLAVVRQHGQRVWAVEGCQAIGCAPLRSMTPPWPCGCWSVTATNSGRLARRPSTDCTACCWKAPAPACAPSLVQVGAGNGARRGRR